MWKTIKVDRERLVESINATVGRVAYKLGAKPGMGTSPLGMAQADCSGYVRWLIHRITHSEVLMPDGSWHQAKWCADQGFKLTDYSMCGLKDDRLRIAFIPTYRGSVGHVWLVVNGKTIESYGGKGVGRRPWNQKTLRSKVTECYVLTEPMNG
jgi:cell wall-associated NlpC family hydrolase